MNKHLESLTRRLLLPHVERVGDSIVQSLTNVVRGVQSEVAAIRHQFPFRFVRHVLTLQREIPSLQVRAEYRKHSRCDFNAMGVSGESL